MNILCIAQRVPYPPNRGDKLAAYHAIRHLAHRHAVTVAALAESAEEMENARRLEALGVTVVVALHRASAARSRALAALFTGGPLSVAYYCSPQLRRRIVELRRSVTFDVIVTFSSSMGQYADALGEIPLVADFVDMDSEKWALYASWTRWPWSWVYATEARRLLEYERRLSRRAHCTLVVTEAERRDCVRLLPGARFEVLSNGVDLEYFQSRTPRIAGHGIVFTGVMDYFPNVQAVTHFCDDILPLVRRAVPDAAFTIVGSRPTRAVTGLGRRPGVSVVGGVPDVRPYLNQAAVAVAPMQLARGVQNKVLEAMAMETPVVATRPAAGGVGAPEGEGILVTDSPDTFAAKVVEVLRDPARAAELGRRGRRFVERHCVWEAQLAGLEVMLAEAAHARRELHFCPVPQGSG